MLGSLLPGAPIALITNGACGNLNPPARPVSPEECEAYGRRIADAIADKLAMAHPSEASLRIATDHIALPLESLSPDQIDSIIADPNQRI